MQRQQNLNCIQNAVVDPEKLQLNISLLLCHSLHFINPALNSYKKDMKTAICFLHVKKILLKSKESIVNTYYITNKTYFIIIWNTPDYTEKTKNRVVSDARQPLNKTASLNQFDAPMKVNFRSVWLLQIIKHDFL